MGEVRSRKTDGTTTVIRNGRIVGNLPSGRALSPTSGPQLGSQVGPDSGPDTPTVDSLYTVFAGRNSIDALEAAQDDFQSWVIHAAFASEDDSTRGRFWEGATRYATTPEGRAALERIAANSDTTPALRTAAGVMLAEVDLYGEDIERAWVVSEVADDDAQPARNTAFVASTASVAPSCSESLSSGTSVLGHSSLQKASKTEGVVTLTDTDVEDSTVSDSVVENSTLRQVRIANSTVSGAHIAPARYVHTISDDPTPTSVTDSTVGAGAEIFGATVKDSVIHGHIEGTGASAAGLASTRNVTKYYEVYVNGMGEERSEYADLSIGLAAEHATHSRVTKSTIHQGSSVRNAHLDGVTLKDGTDIDTAIVENSTLEGTAHIGGSFTHKITTLRGYSLLKQIIPRDRRARVSNVHLTREFIGESADVTKQSHVESTTRDGVLITRYRTRFRTKMRRAIWAYTTTTVDPETGSLKRQFVGYDDPREPSRDVQRLADQF
jgi:hypothetical protein